MTEKVPQSPFDSVTHVPFGEVRISEASIEQSNGALRDLLPSEWALGPANSVLFDTSSRRLFVDTFDAMIISANKEQLLKNPAIARVIKQNEETGVPDFAYIANMSYVQHLLYSKLDIGLEDLFLDGHRFEDRQKRNGAQFLGGVVLREFGRLRYEGDPAYEEQAADFTRQFEAFAARLSETGDALAVPFMDTEAIKRPKDVTSIDLATSTQQPRDEQK